MDRIVEWVLNLMSVIGAPGVGVAIAIETVFPPIPSEVVLPLAGFAASHGRYSLLSAIIWATVGSVVGAVATYWLGKAWGQERIGRLADKLPLTSHHDVDRAVDWFQRHGKSAIFFGRLVPGVRSLISIPAGVEGMAMGKFLLLTTLGSGIWNSALIIAGYALGAEYKLVAAYISDFSGLIAIVIGGLVLYFLGKRARARLRDDL